MSPPRIHRAPRARLARIVAVALAVVALSSSAFAAEGLVVAYAFDEAGGSAVIDASGNGHNATLADGGSRDLSGVFGSAAEFNGISGHVDLGGLDVPGAALTIEFWFKPRSFGITDARLISKADGVAEQDHYWMVSTIDGPRLRFRLKTTVGGTSTLIANGATLVADTWAHVAATYDGTRMRLYLNGVSIGSMAKIGALVTNPAVASWVGDNPGNTRPFDGSIDELRIYDRALATAEIQSDMTAPILPAGEDTESPTAPSGLVAGAFSSSRIDLTWGPATDNVGVAGYDIERDGIVVGSAEALFYSDSGLAPSTTYSYRVTAFDLAGNPSPPSEPVIATTRVVDDQSPSAPSVLLAIPVSATRIDLSWSEAQDDVGVVEYRIERDGDTIASTASTVYVDDGLTPDTAYLYRVFAIDADGNVSPPSPEVIARTDANSSATLIDVWYGGFQTFGEIGRPQRWVNILGSVSDPQGVALLEYSLNGGGFVPLAVGPDMRRLYFPGDFDVEIDYEQLQIGANPIVIRATDGDGERTERSVTVQYDGREFWPENYFVDWSASPEIARRVQIVDGIWTRFQDGVRPVRPGYDRLLAVGDMAWDDYEIVMPFTVFSIDPAGFTGVSAMPGFGLIMRWNGHTDEPVVCPQPHCGWRPNGSSAWYWWDEFGGMPGSIGGSIVDPQRRPIDLQVAYVMKMRVETVPGSGPLYKYKIWRASESEPTVWTASGVGNPDVTHGSTLIVAHHVDVLIGDLAVQPLPDVTAPDPPPSLLATPTSAFGVSLEWSPALDDFQVVEYRVYRDGALVGTTDTTAYNDAILDAETLYAYDVAALDEAGNESVPESTIVRTLSAPPGPPCGDGIRDAGEQCDDGGTEAGDGCSVICTLEVSVENVLVNGDFAGGPAAWNFYSDADARMRIVDGQATITITAEGENVQLFQRGLTLAGDADYRLSFTASSLFADDLQLSVLMHDPPNTNYGLNRRRVNLSPTAERHSVEFTTTSGDKTGARLMVAFGSFDRDGGEYVLDDFVLRRLAGLCGDGALDPGEVCDDGNLDNADACLNDCSLATCGDGWIQLGPESCEDGNAVDGDGCSARCTLETSGRAGGVGPTAQRRRPAFGTRGAAVPGMRTEVDF